MRRPITFFVAGKPAPGGSKTGFCMRYGDKSLIIRNMRIVKGKVYGNPVITMVDAGGKANKAWRNAVKKSGKEQAKRYLDGVLLSGPLAVKLDFVMPRPKAHFGTGRNASVLKAASPIYHTTTPDVLKLTRSTEDALTGALWVDDKQIVSESVNKRYGAAGEVSGCYITVEELSNPTGAKP